MSSSFVRSMITLVARSLVGSSILSLPSGCAELPTRDHAPVAGEQVRPFNPDEIRSPVLTRVAATPARLAAARVHVPDGTRAFYVRTPGDETPDVLAWYAADTGRLIAAIRLDAASEDTPTRPGVSLTSGAVDGDQAAAIVTIRDADSVPALLRPEGVVSLRPDGGPAGYDAAPLLSIEGSSILHALTPRADTSLQRAGAYAVKAQSADGVYEARLKADACSPAIQPDARMTQVGVPTSIVFRNTGAADALVAYEIPPGLRQVDGTPNPTIAPAGGSAHVRVVPERKVEHFVIPFRQTPIERVERGRVAGPASGIAVTDGGGAFSTTFLSCEPVRSVSTPDGSSVITRSGQPIPAPGSGGSFNATPIAVTGAVGAAFGLGTLIFDRAASNDEVTISTVPASLDDAEGAASDEAVTISAVGTSGTLLSTIAQDADKCEHSGKTEVHAPAKNAGEKPKGAPVLDKDGFSAHVSAEAKASGCCCLASVTLSLEFKAYYARWYWQETTELGAKQHQRPESDTGPSAGQVPGKKKWVYYKREEVAAAHTYLIELASDDEPDCEEWGYDDNPSVPWKDLAAGFLKGSADGKWPPKGEQFELTNLYVQAVLTYTLKPKDDTECPFPKGEIKRRSKQFKLPVAGLPFVGDKPPMQ